MLKTYRESILVRTCDCDMSGRMSVSRIFAFLQEGAGVHAHLLGCGRDVMLKNGIVWVLARSELHMDRYPAVGETLCMETFPMPNRRWFFPRYFILTDEAGLVLGKAATLWLLMDFKTRAMAPPDLALTYLPDNSDLDAPLPFPGNVTPVYGEAQLSVRKPEYSDIDVNLHVNNTRYGDWLCDALGMKVMRRREIARLLIHYQREIKPEQEIRLSLQCNGDAARMTGIHEDAKHFDMGVILRDRATACEGDETGYSLFTRS